MMVVHVVRLCFSTEKLPSGENLLMLPEEMPTEHEEDLCASTVLCAFIFYVLEMGTRAWSILSKYLGYRSFLLNMILLCCPN